MAIGGKIISPHTCPVPKVFAQSGLLAPKEGSLFVCNCGRQYEVALRVLERINLAGEWLRD